jgi:hypothetical protein
MSSGAIAAILLAIMPQGAKRVGVIRLARKKERQGEGGRKERSRPVARTPKINGWHGEAIMATSASTAGPEMTSQKITEFHLSVEAQAGQQT